MEQMERPLLLMLKRFLGDFFSIFIGTTKQLHALFNEIKKVHLTLKFTFKHTNREGARIEDICQCNSKCQYHF